ncbi:MAG TPA: hypothetical protein VG735_08070 [Caulobacterales bacterium]|nr:hypothetical protein [Caulobacterales bacterium]
MRRADWPERLAAYINGREAVAFAWGPNDCCSFAAGAVLALTGDDPMRALRRRYRSARGATRLLNEQTLESHLDERFARVGVAMAHRGDVALVEIEGRPSVAIVEGEMLVAPGLNGLVRVPRGLAVGAWRVG